MERNRLHPAIAKLTAQLERREISRREFLRTSTLLGLSAGAAYGIVNKLDGGSLIEPAAAQDAQRPGGSIRLGYYVLDITRPQATDTIETGSLTFATVQPLTRIGPDGVTRPLLCESWKPSDDLKSWTIKLRPNAKWRKGRSFVADDVIANIKRLLDPANGSGSLGVMRSYMLKEVEKNGAKTTEIWDANALEKVDDYTVRINVKSPQVAIPEHLTQYTSVMVDPEEGGIFKPGANGTGPFELVEFEVQRRAVFKKWAGYWGRPAFLDQVEFVHPADENSMLTMLASKQVDGVATLPFNLIENARALPHVQIYAATTATTATLHVDCSIDPWKDPRVRQALRLSVDPQKQVELALRGHGKPGEHHHVCPVHPDYAPLPSVPQDIAKAKQLLKEAGHESGLSFECYVPAAPTWEAISLQGMAEDFRAIGVNMKINVVPRPRYLEIWDKVPAIYTDWGHRPLGIQLLNLVYRSDSPWNIAKWKNAEFDDALTQADGVPDPVARRKFMARCEEILRTSGPMLQPVWVNVETGYDKRIQGFQMRADGNVAIEDLSLKA